LIGLNAHLAGNAMKQQMGWLASAVDVADPANRQRCVLAFWHAPTFSSGRHGHDYKTDPKTPLTMKRPMQAAFRILHRHGATAILAGHDHDYEQFAPQDADGSATVDGVRQFVVGTGGSLLTEDLYDHMASNSEGVFGRTKGAQGVLKIEVFANRYRWQFLSIDPNKSIALKTTEAECTARQTPPG
jgi:acid phosphatase type 7